MNEDFICAVLTGDLIGSTEARPEQVEASMQILSTLAAEIGSETRFTRYRGDGWQLMLTSPGLCLRSVLLAHARLRAAPDALETRIAVGIGAGFHHGADSLSAATGPAFIASGRALEAMDRGSLFALAGEVDAFQKQCFTFTADLAGRWSTAQAEAMAAALLLAQPTHEAIADRMGITRQAVSARLKAADFHILQAACTTFETEYTRLFVRSAPDD